MIFCDECSKEILGDKYVYSPENKHEGKKFCSTICMHKYYAPHCEKCGEQAAKWVYSTDHNDGKKFCSSACMEQYYRVSQPKSQPQSEESRPEEKENKSTNQAKEDSPNPAKELNLTHIIVGIVIFSLIVAIIWATISWLFKRIFKNNKPKK